MSHLEPNVIGLCWFVPLWSVCCLAFFQLAGMYPLRTDGEGGTSSPALLVLGSTALWLLLLAGTLAFAWAELRWTTVVVVAGILFLFAPGLLQAVPARFRDGRAGLALSGVVLIAALATLACIGVSHA